MPEQFLTTREFDVWREEHDKKVDRLLIFAEQAQKDHHKADIRLTKLEVEQERRTMFSGRIGAVVNIVIAAGTSALFSYFRGK